MPKCLLVHWAGSAYDSLRSLLVLLEEELHGLGLSTETILVNEEGWVDRLRSVLKAGDVEFAIGMSGVGSDIGRDGELLWDRIKVPFFNWNCDHPAYYPSRHGRRSRYLLHGYVFPDHARYHQRHLSPNGVAFAAHLGIPDRARTFPAAPLSLAQRNGRLIYAKSGGDPEALRREWPRRVPAFLLPVVAEAAEEGWNASTLDLTAIVQRLAERRGIFLTGDSAMLLSLIRVVDTYIRLKRADLVCQALRPFPVDIFGNGWDHIDMEGARAVRHGAKPLAELTRMLPEYLGSVSTHPMVEHSLHDRVFFALAAGVVPISNDNAFLRSEAPGLMGYSFCFDAASVAAAAENLLQDPGAGVAIAEQAHRQLLPSCSLRESARQIVAFCRLAPLNSRA